MLGHTHSLHAPACRASPTQQLHQHQQHVSLHIWPSSRWRVASARQSRPLIPAQVWGRRDKSSSPSTSPAPGSLKGKPVTTTSNKRQLQQQPSKYSTVGGKREPGGGGNREPDSDEQGWRLFDLSLYSARWDVPWSGGATLGGMLAWFFSFIAVGIIAVPGLYRYAGWDIATMPMADKANFTLVCQAVETLVGLAVIRVFTAGALKEQQASTPSSSQAAPLFNYSLKGPFRAPYGWAAWALAGVLIAPLVVGTTAAVVSLAGYEESIGGKGTVDGVIGMIDVDLGTYLSLVAVTGVLAPVLEETVFRGFLLPALCKSMPTWAAVGLSSLLFGAAHLSGRDLPVLVALGCLLGFTYIRSNNLLTPIIIHGVWNSSVLTLLFVLVASGVDVESALRELR